MAKKKILVVDDEVEFVDAVKMMFDAHGYDVIGAYNGLDGVEKAKKNSPSVILLDLAMPVVSGFDALTQLKNDPRTSLIPVIVITAQNDIEYAFDAGKLGANDYVIKPVRMESLLELINKYTR